jgi:hypothetical protein
LQNVIGDSEHGIINGSFDRIVSQKIIPFLIKTDAIKGL